MKTNIALKGEAPFHGGFEFLLFSSFGGFANLPCMARFLSFTLGKTHPFNHSYMEKRMKKILIILLTLFCNEIVAAPAVDFSQAYVIPEQSGMGKISLGGVNVIDNNQKYNANFTLFDDYSLHVTDGSLLTSPAEILEQKLRNSVWQGKYIYRDLSFISTLTIKIVQSGFISGQILHTNVDTTKNDMLDVRVAGDIVSQFQINSTWYDSDRIPNNLSSQINANTPTQYVLRLKRIGANKYVNGSNGWNYNREYRMTLDSTGILSGTVAIPPDLFGGTETGDYGSIIFTRIR